MQQLLRDIAAVWRGDGGADAGGNAVDRYAAHRANMAERARSASKAGRDIGEIPPVADPERRAACEASLELYCTTYHGETFDLPFCDDHIRGIERLQAVIHGGGQRAFAMPRGNGKTSLCETAAEYALLYGFRRYVALIGAEKTHALEMLDSIRTELETNDLLLADFPEVCYVLRLLEGIAQRRLLYRGETIKLRIRGDKMILPWISGSKAAGAVLHVAGLTGRIRGMKHKLPGGESLRPDLAIVDDPQTDDSARSEEQSAYRERIVAGAVLGLAGPKTKIAAVMPCTVIQQGDMADRILDRKLHPEWNGERTKLIYEFPTNEKLWDEYAELRADGMRNDDDGKAGDDFYRKHRAAMDAGARPAWEQRHPGALSAIQFAMNWKIDNEAAFFAEAQNDPLEDKPADEDLLTADEIAAKINRLKRGRVPIECSHVVSFIDVQAKLLFYGVAAFADDFSGAVVDYGTFPDQERLRFTKRDAQKTLARRFPGTTREAHLYAGLEELCQTLLALEWRRDDGSQLRIGRLLIDANWGESTDVVYQFCRQSPHAAVLYPSHGKFYGPTSQPMSEYKKKPGDRIGHHWRIPNPRGRRQVRYVLFDSNFWKSFFQARLATPMGAKGGVALFGDRASRHRLLAEHLTAEARHRPSTEAGRSVDVWKEKPNRDNDWLDCFVGCCVAASIQGVKLKSGDVALEAGREARKKMPLKLSELKRQRGR